MWHSFDFSFTFCGMNVHLPLQKRGTVVVGMQLALYERSKNAVQSFPSIPGLYYVNEDLKGRQWAGIDTIIPILPSETSKGKKHKHEITRPIWKHHLQKAKHGQLLSHKVAKWLSKTKRCKRHTHSKTNYNKNKPWQKNRLGTVSKKYFTGGGGGGGA